KTDPPQVFRLPARRAVVYARSPVADRRGVSRRSPPTRMVPMRFRIAAAALSAALAAPALAADPPCPKCEAACPAPAAGAVVKVFAVADLVTPIPDFAFPTAGQPRPMPAPPVVAQERVAVQPYQVGL